MKFHDITKCDMKNGVGIRVVLWVSGCEHFCKNCQNPITWDRNCGVDFDEEAKKELFYALSQDYCDGVTFSGGDPFAPYNREEVFKLIKEIKDKLPTKTVWVYTGYTYEELQGESCLAQVDVLVDGKFIEAKKDLKLRWRGSSNQRIINVQESLKQGKVVERVDLY